MMAIDHELGYLIRTWRERELLTQDQLAGLSGLGVRTIRRLESGRGNRPRGESVRLLADALKLSEAEREKLTSAARPFVPRQLPADVAGFSGRIQQLRCMGGNSIVAVTGTAGVGKTALAVHWAHRAAHRFPDGQLYVDLRGFDPSGLPMTPAEALLGFLQGFALPPERIPADLDARAGLYRSLLAGRRVLVVLDNACDVEQVRPLLPGTAGSTALVTSRNQLSGLMAAEGAQCVTLDRLTRAEARELLGRRLGRERVAAERRAVTDIITSCDRLPLALVIMSARAASNPAFPLAALATELTDSHRRLDTLDTGDRSTQVRAVFSWSYTRLHEAAAQLYRLLSLHPGPDITVAAAASLAGRAVGETAAALAELTRVHLINEHRPGRFGLHDLLRLYATELCQANDPAHRSRAAERRMLDHYLHSARSADRLLYPHRDPTDVEPGSPLVSPERPADFAQAMAWFDAERAVLLAVLRHAADRGFDPHVWCLAWAFTTFFQRRSYWQELSAAHTGALDAARRARDLGAQAHAHRELGFAHNRLKHPATAESHLRTALELFTDVGDRTGQARTHLALNWALELQGCHDEAHAHALRALRLFTEAAKRSGQADALNVIGWHHALMGEHERAIVHCEQALALHQEVGNLS